MLLSSLASTIHISYAEEVLPLIQRAQSETRQVNPRADIIHNYLRWALLLLATDLLLDFVPGK